MCNPNSTFKQLIKYVPDVLTYLFDRCLVKVVEEQVQGRIYFDFFLFEIEAEDDNASEMNLYRTLVLAGKTKFIIHPLLDMFVKMKRNRFETLFLFYFFATFFYNASLIFYVLQHYSSVSSFIPGVVSWYFL